jgi:hypothetical protein
MTDRTPVFHLDTLNLNFSDYEKRFFIGPQPRNFMGNPLYTEAKQNWTMSIWTNIKLFRRISTKLRSFEIFAVFVFPAIFFPFGMIY